MTISVIIATKNEQKNLERLLVSLKRQTFQELETIIVDNYSTDRTAQIAQKYTSKVFQKGPERTTQRNFGIKKAGGKYILFVDADMQLESNVLGECLKSMENNPKLSGIIIDEVSKGAGFLAKIKALEKQLTTGEETIEAARFFRKKDLVKIGGYDKKLISGEDWDLSQRMAKFGEFGRIKSKINHFENQSIWQDIKKKYYYAKNIQPYARKYPKLWNNQQANFISRIKILFKNPDLIRKNPLEFTGLLLLKLSHFAAFIIATQSLVLTIVFLGIILRLIGAFTFPITFDEAHHIMTSRAPSLIQLITLTATTHLPLYFLILNLWQNISQNIFFLRILSTIFGIATITTAIIVGQKIFNRKTGLIAGLLFAISPSQIYYGSIARMYALEIFFVLITIHLFHNFIQQKRRLVPFIIAATLGLYTHFFFIFLLIATFIYWFFSEKTATSPKLKIGLFLGIIYLPALLLLITTTRFLAEPIVSLVKLPLFFLEPVFPWDLFQSLKIYQQSNQQLSFQIQNVDLPSFAVISLGLLAQLLFIFTLFRYFKNRNVRYLASIYLIPAVLILLISFTLIKIAGIRSYVIFSPAFFLIIGFFLSKISRKWIILALSSVFLFSVMFFAGYFQQNISSKNPPGLWHNFETTDQIIYNNPSLFLPTLVKNPPGEHFLMSKDFMRDDELTAFNINITQKEQIDKTKPVWYVRQNTRWPPYEQFADDLEKYLHENFKEVKRLQYFLFEIILFALK